ncbi:MAG: hypothetical protein IKP01_07705, partial [Bacteroidales bacterium]|nr:hypothetical protein [Bacteroidales bacterium]MBR4688184.1 hypothetical protein [Bacteroidales bacterium]
LPILGLINEDFSHSFLLFHNHSVFRFPQSSGGMARRPKDGKACRVGFPASLAVFFGGGCRKKAYLRIG